MINPYPEKIQDEALGVIVTNELHTAFKQGYDARSRELELVAQQLEQTVKQVDKILEEIRWKQKQ